MNFLLLSGSFHSKSRSLAILSSVKEILAGHLCELPRLDALPFYSEDIKHEKPQCVTYFISVVTRADGVIFCTPEYNHSIPAVLKNAIDWASRPAFNSSLKGKPVSIITQAVSPVGGARAQAHLKLVLDSTLSVIHPCHEMMIPDIDQVVGPTSHVTDQKVLARLEKHIGGFVDFVDRHRNATA